MEDGPEFAEGSYDFAGKTYRLAEVDSQVWRVYDGDTYIGIVTETDATAAEPWPRYTEHSAGDETDAACSAISGVRMEPCQTNGALWCSPIAKTSRPTSSALTATFTDASMSSYSSMSLRSAAATGPGTSCPGPRAWFAGSVRSAGRTP